MPATVFMVEIRDGVDVSTRFNIFSESIAGGSLRMTYLTRLPSQTTSSRWQVDKKAIGLLRVQQFYHLCVACSDHISVNSIFKHIHTTSINTIIWQFVPFIYHHL